MPSTTIVNFMTVVHKSSTGVLMTFPDVCKTPTPAGPVPIPYPNIAQSSDTAKGSKTVKVDGEKIMLDGSNFKTSTGDEAGSAGGVVSSKTKGKAEFVNYSFDVKADGKPVCRLLDPMLSNKGGAPNTPPAPELQAPAVVMPTPSVEDVHVVPIFFSYKQPEAASGRDRNPEFETSHDLKGASNSKADSKAAYAGYLHEDVDEGDYKIEFAKWDLEKRPLRFSEKKD